MKSILMRLKISQSGRLVSATRYVTLEGLDVGVRRFMLLQSTNSYVIMRAAGGGSGNTVFRSGYLHE